MPNNTIEEICLEKVEKLTQEKLKTVGKDIKKFRLERNLTQSDTAFYIFTDKSLVSSLERGCCKNMTLNSIIRFAALFDMEITISFSEKYEL